MEKDMLANALSDIEWDRIKTKEDLWVYAIISIRVDVTDLKIMWCLELKNL